MSGFMRLMSDALRRLFSVYPVDTRVSRLRDHLRRSQPRRADQPGVTVVAVQSVEDPLYFGLFSAIVCELGRHSRIRTDLIVVRAISGAIGVGWRAGLMRSAAMTWILSSQWVRAYRGLNARVGYRSQSLAHPLEDLVDWLRALGAWRRTRQPAGRFSLLVDGVPVGDLVNDSYLRFRPSPRFDAADPFVLRLIWQCYRDVRRARRYFARHKPRIYLTSYSSYVEHGVAVRVALAEGVRVFSFGNFVQFGKQLTMRDWYHTPNCEHYKAVFESLDCQDDRLARAEQQLKLRLAGGIDAATSYMRVSAYSAEGVHAPPGVRGAVVVFLHDFYDSPHVYHDLVFDDFWAWICFTVETLDAAGIRFFLKPHPNQIELSNAVLQELRAAYPGVRFIPSGVTNVQLVDAGMACGVTVYGTVAHELAYLGVPTIACARHPHNAFDICRTARDAKQYAQFLRTPFDSPLDKPTLRRQALAFYYMHNLHGEADDLALRAGFIAWWKACQDRGVSDEDVAACLDRLRGLPAFAGFAARLA